MMRRVAFAFFLIIGAVAARAEVSCDYGGTQAQMNVCAFDEYARADAALNAAYKHAMARLGGATKAKLKQAQRLWLPYRDAACEAEAGPFDGGSIQPLIRAGCLTRLTKSRTQDLRTIAD